MSDIVLVTGAFDIMHIGHIRMLQWAFEQADTLVVMIDDDQRIRNTKGDNRPFNDLRDRREFLSALRGVRGIMTISTDEDIVNFCKEFKPIRVVGGDWRGKPIVGEEFCSEIRYFDRIPGYSTTRIIDGK